MDMRPEPFVPPAPMPRTVPPTRLQIIWTVMHNPLELWGRPSFTLPWIETKFFKERTLIVNDPGLIRHVLVDNAANYEMSEIRQLILRPILRDGLLTAEGPVWKRSRKAMAPVFTPKHARGFAGQMLAKAEEYAARYADAGPDGKIFDISVDMTELTFAILSETLFSGEIVTASESFSDDVDRLLHRMGRVDPMDLLRAPPWVPRLTRIGGSRVLGKFRKVVADTMALRRQRMAANPDDTPQDFLTLLLQLEGPDGLTPDEIEDNILTFIGAGHETTARALAWTLYCVAQSPHVRERMEEEIDHVLATGAEPVEWLDLMPWTRAAFEEALRLYPPAPSINRAAIADDHWVSPSGETVRIDAGVTVLVMPWTLHRHELYWEKPRAFMPERFLPENRGAIGRFQYLPFGAGPRICIGATFAMQEAVIALAVLMHRYQFDVTPETKVWPVQKLTTQPRDGIPMRVSPR
ncbi:cytochrome P450 [Neorhizobium petrolearium]|uniref:Cytochrome P450 n=1 Tax=Neorhizobium petrolearium TaxID=515361 RepID=A0ABY8M063_9HYPH|nr:cytochrome P450 [Neorhizobium petrolearium]MCC2612856.1 cytochrome P450 [Neorhizobium petrolearium]WGI67967.1 cytochrome P450 [Neorhizobium petrolearium]